ncbi:MAG TPA: tol-pal system protein [Brevundimonas sp.]
MLKLSSARTKTVLATALGVALIGGTVVAQTQTMEPIIWDKRRLDQLDRNVRRLERALTQRNAAGQPVIMETDPEVVVLQGQFAAMERRQQDLEQSLRQVNGELERMGFELDEAKRENGTLRTRLNDANTRIDTVERAAREAAELNAPITANSPSGTAAGDLAAAVRLVGSNPARGARALEVLLVTWPDAPEAREASYRLGDMSVAANDEERALDDYALALRGWPTAPWAADATLKLTSLLIDSDEKTRACGALGEFTRRYAPGATAAQRTRANELKTQAGCR